MGKIIYFLNTKHKTVSVENLEWFDVDPDPTLAWLVYKSVVQI